MERPVPASVVPDSWADLRRFTTARLALGRAGDSLPTDAVLAFGIAHAAARDAVAASLDAAAIVDALAAAGFHAVRVHSGAASRPIYLRRPDLGRRLDGASRTCLAAQRGAGGAGADVVFVLADGLSARAVASQGVALLVALRARLPGWAIAPVVVAAHGRVALGDEVGEVLGATLAVVLIGERPGLSVPESLGAYLTHRPRVGRTDAERNCVSNIHAAGLDIATAADRIAWLLGAARLRGHSGVALKDASRDGHAVASPDASGTGVATRFDAGPEIE